MSNRLYLAISLLLFASVANAQIPAKYLKPLQQPFVEPDSSMKSGSGVSQFLDIRINEFMASNDITYADESGEYEDWIELYNFGDTEVDLNGMYVSDDPNEPLKYQLSASGNELVVPAKTYFILWADDDESDGANHLNFKLSADGESILLSSSGGVLIDSYTFGPQNSDISEGLAPGTSSWNFYTTPTPLAPNGTDGLSDQLPEPIPSVLGGFFTSSTTININYPETGASLHYTTDGSEPTQLSNTWSDGLNINTTTTLRVKAFKTGFLPSEAASHTYLFDNDFTLDVISIQGDPEAFFGSSGIYDNEYAGLEKRIHIEYFTAEGNLGMEANAGIKIHSPKNHPQKSFRIYARGEYGDSEFNYPFFEDKDISVFKRLILRNGSNDSQPSGLTHFKDGMYHQLFGSAGKRNHYSAYRPVHVYLNGTYWGIYNLRERQDRYYARENIGTEHVDMLERTMDTPSRFNAIEGNFDEYNVLDDFVKNNDMSIQANYEIVKEQVNIENYVDYYIFGVFSGNRDWYENNTKWVKPKAPGHKWEWMMWDVEYGLGTYRNYDHGKPDWAAIFYARTRGGWPYSSTWKNTYFLRNLLDNKEFRDYFSNRYADLLNTTLREENVLTKIAETKALLEPDIDKQINRWGLSKSKWEDAINYFEYYVSNRPFYARKNMIKKVHNLYADSIYPDSVNTIFVDVSPAGSGKIKINTITPENYPFDGIYFNSVPIAVTAIPNEGYQFSGWSEDTINKDWFTHLLLEDLSITAFFEPEEDVSTTNPVINEISYNQHSSWETGDWVELKNTSNQSITLNGWFIGDEDFTHFSSLPAITIPANGFVVLAQDADLFSSYHPEVTQVIEALPFGLASGGDAIKLYNASQELVDQVVFDNKAPWPVAADGDGPSLELYRNQILNNSSQYWFTVDDEYGTPGKINHDPTGISELTVDEIKIAPNPFINQLHIESSSNGTWHLKSITGKSIAQGQLISNTPLTINTQSFNLNAGVYLLELNTPQKTFIKQVAKL